MSLQKINTFILKGPTNTGKSMLLQTLLQPIQPVTISREKDRSSFHLDQLPSSSSVIVEEPIIENTTVGTWKLLMEGSTIQTDIKHQDKEDIHRLPIYMTTNSDIHIWCNAVEKEPLMQRYFLHNLSLQITSRISQKNHYQLPQNSYPSKTWLTS
jgi:hypothetical protein